MFSHITCASPFPTDMAINRQSARDCHAVSAPNIDTVEPRGGEPQRRWVVTQQLHQHVSAMRTAFMNSHTCGQSELHVTTSSDCPARDFRWPAG